MIRLRRRMKKRWQRTGFAPLWIVLLLLWWAAVTIWYPLFIVGRVSLWSLRRDARKRRELKAQRSANPHV
jgi:hypothetical protein